MIERKIFEMVNIPKQEFGNAKIYEHKLLDERSPVVDRHLSIAAKICVDEYHDILPTL